MESYRIAAGTSLEELEQSVCRFAKLGYVPVGGPNHVLAKPRASLIVTYEFYQAMVLEIKNG